eukprot:945965-Pyramimonas_sp.AAC.1
MLTCSLAGWALARASGWSTVVFLLVLGGPWIGQSRSSSSMREAPGTSRWTSSLSKSSVGVDHGSSR